MHVWNVACAWLKIICADRSCFQDAKLEHDLEASWHLGHRALLIVGCAERIDKWDGLPTPIEDAWRCVLEPADRWIKEIVCATGDGWRGGLWSFTCRRCGCRWLRDKGGHGSIGATVGASVLVACGNPSLYTRTVKVLVAARAQHAIVSGLLQTDGACGVHACACTCTCVCVCVFVTAFNALIVCNMQWPVQGGFHFAPFRLGICVGRRVASLYMSIVNGAVVS